MHSGIEFVDDGLRLRMHLGPKVELPTVPKPKPGKVIGKGVELSAYKVGKTLSYSGEQAYGPHSWKFETVAIEKTPKGLLVRSREPWSDEDDSGDWEGVYLIGEDGIRYQSGKDEFTSATHTKYPLDLPLELRLHEMLQFEAAGEIVYDEEGVKDVDPFSERTELKVLGLETVKTKAGTFKDCVLVERRLRCT